MSIQIFDEQQDLLLNKSKIKKLTRFILDFLEEPFFEVALHFVNVETICKLHQEYFNDPTPTDCISFPLDPKNTPKRVLGDIFICTKIAIVQAKEYQTSPLFEVSLYLIHGLLHLIGYKDHTTAMQKKQDDCINRAKNHSLLLSN